MKPENCRCLSRMQPFSSARGCVEKGKDNLLDADLADDADYKFIGSAKSAPSASKE